MKVDVCEFGYTYGDWFYIHAVDHDPDRAPLLRSAGTQNLIRFSLARARRLFVCPRQVASSCGAVATTAAIAYSPLVLVLRQSVVVLANTVGGARGGRRSAVDGSARAASPPLWWQVQQQQEAKQLQQRPAAHARVSNRTTAAYD